MELRRRYVDCFDGVDEPYDILLDDFEPYTTTAEVREIFDELKAELVPLIAELRDIEVDDSFMIGNFPVDRQERVAKEVVEPSSASVPTRGDSIPRSTRSHRARVSTTSGSRPTTTRRR